MESPIKKLILEINNLKDKIDDNLLRLNIKNNNNIKSMLSNNFKSFISKVENIYDLLYKKEGDIILKEGHLTALNELLKKYINFANKTIEKADYLKIYIKEIKIKFDKLESKLLEIRNKIYNNTQQYNNDENTRVF